MSQRPSAPDAPPLGAQVSNMPSIYNTYLCREPAGDVPILIRNGPDEYTASLRTLQRSADYFGERDHTRAVERLQLEMARVHMQNQQWERATQVLVPLWQALSWRRSGWWQMLEEMDLALSECARHVKDYDILIGVEWELSNNSLTPRQDGRISVVGALEDKEPRPKATIQAENIVSCISASFGFGTAQGYVGELLSSQLILSSQSHKAMAPITISKIKVAFGGGLKDVVVEHNASKRPAASTIDGLIHLYRINLESQVAGGSPTPVSTVMPQNMPLVGSADLALAPDERICLCFDHVPRDAGDLEVTSITLYVGEKDYDIELIITEDDDINQEASWVSSPSGLSQKRLRAGRSNIVKILPKPPKLKIELPDLAPTYFTDESIPINILITNEEEDEADVTLDIRIVDPPGQTPEMKWISTDDDNPLEHKISRLPSKYIGNIATSVDQMSRFCIQATSEGAEYLLEIRASYHLFSDPETPITKTHSAKVLIKLPFEAIYTFLPLLSSEAWPSYFDIDDSDKRPPRETTNPEIARGLAQRWSLTSRIASLADVVLCIDGVEPCLIGIHENAMCRISPATGSSPSLSSISPNDLQERIFVIEAQKLDVEDRQPTFLDIQLRITWRRRGAAGSSNVTSLAVSELVIPFGEPRVLASARNGEAPSGIVSLDYVIENPSMYTLNFSLTMETSEEFAFSGVKNVSVQLVPLSRHTVQYNLMPLVKGQWITPQFRVFDTHFRKTLKVNATEGMRTEAEGVQVWVNTDE